MRFAPRSLVIKSAIFVAINLVSAVLEKRADALGAWETWLYIHFGLLVPGLCFALAAEVGRFELEPTERDAQRVRFGKNRRYVILTRYTGALLMGLILETTLLVLGRTITYPAFSTCFSRDIWICSGIGVLATITYIGFYSALAKLGLGRIPVIIGFLVDLTLGHSDISLAFLVPQRHIAQLLGTPNHFSISTPNCSLFLLGIFAFSTAWIFFRTPR
jgi:hypothetical protein